MFKKILLMLFLSAVPLSAAEVETLTFRVSSDGWSRMLSGGETPTPLTAPMQRGDEAVLLDVIRTEGASFVCAYPLTFDATGMFPNVKMDTGCQRINAPSDLRFAVVSGDLKWRLGATPEGGASTLAISKTYSLNGVEFTIDSEIHLAE